MENAAEYGVSKRRTRRKLSLAVTDNSCHDGEMLGTLLDEITDPISRVDADGAYDTRHCYDFIEQISCHRRSIAEITM